MLKKQVKGILIAVEKNKENIISTGGARIGWMNATWPFAVLSADQNCLEINATLIGRYSFTSDQIISIEKYTRIPFFSWGIKINHIVAEYPSRIIFWCFEEPEKLLKKIQKNGFIPKASKIPIPPTR